MLFCNDFNNKILTDMDLAEAEKYNIIPEQSGISSLVRRNCSRVVGLEGRGNCDGLT